MAATDTTAAELDALESGEAWARLDPPGLLRVAGSDHREALQRVVSQDVRGMRAGDGRLALLLAPKGQFQALFAMFAAEDEMLLLAPPGRGEELVNGLGKYLRFSRSRIEPVEVAGAWAALGPRWQDLASDLVAEPGRVAAGGWSGGESGRVLGLGQTLLGAPGMIVAALDAAAAAALGGRLAGTGAKGVGRDALDLERIRTGWPAWGAELDGAVLPPEVGIEKHAISYSKGCYIGQETIARMATYGHPNRALVGLLQRSGDGAAPALPAPLAARGEEKSRGALTSWGLHPRLGGVGLALVRRELAAVGTRLLGAGREFEVAPLPLW